MNKNVINEDIAITDPALAQQYSNGKQQLVNKDSQINALNKQILKLQQDKIKIQQLLDQIEQKSSQPAAAQTNQPNTQNQTTPQNKQMDQAQRALAAQILMNKPTSESVDASVLARMNITNKLAALNEELNGSTLEQSKSIIDEIIIITEELKNTEEPPENPFNSSYFYNLSEAYEENSEEDYRYIMYVEIEDKDNKFMAKIYKTSPDSNWYGKIVYGTSRTFEKMEYQKNYEEDDILNYLIDTYDKVRLLSTEEYDNYKEEDIFYNGD